VGDRRLGHVQPVRDVAHAQRAFNQLVQDANAGRIPKKAKQVGDGINDAPVLSRADVGLAMGAMGSDAAIEAADVVLMDDRLEKLPRAVAIARRTILIARQNVVFALTVKALVLLLGAVGLANMWMALAADVGVALLAILNAARALKAD
jgi:Cd2+/Zn2+-exporting ATPase